MPLTIFGLGWDLITLVRSLRPGDREWAAFMLLAGMSRRGKNAIHFAAIVATH